MRMRRMTAMCLAVATVAALLTATTAIAQLAETRGGEGANVWCPPFLNGEFENGPVLFYMECLDEYVVIGGGFVMEWCIRTTPSGNEIHKMRYHLNTADEDPPYYLIRDSGGENETTYYAIQNRMNYHDFHGSIDVVHYNEFAWVESDAGERLRLQFSITPDGLRHGSCPIEFVGPVKPRAAHSTWGVVKRLFR